MKNFTYIAIIIALTIFSFHQCNKNNNFQQKIEINNQARNDTIEFYENEKKQLVAEKKAFQTTIKEMDLLIDDILNDNEQLKNTIASFKKPKSASSTDIKVQVKDVDVKFAKPIPFNFEREFEKITNQYAISGIVNQSGFTFNFLATNRQTLATGLKKKGLFSSDFTSELTNSNNIFTVTDMTNIDFTERKKRFGISVFGGYGFTSNFQFQPVIGIGVSYDIFRF